MSRRTCKILAQIGMSFLVMSTVLADDDPSAATGPTPAAAPAAPHGTRSTIILRGGGGFGGAGGGGFGGGAFAQGPNGEMVASRNATLSINARVNVSDRPAVISTLPMDAQTQTQFKEDLSIMDKLVHESLAEFSDGSVPQAMGIHLMMLGNSTPMYVEGAGAIFSATLSPPLAATTQPDAKPENKPGDSGSAWDRAKSEIEQSQGTNTRQVVITGMINDNAKGEPVQVDDLCAAVIKILPEAKNIRSLKPDESVFVTITGCDTAGASVRVTLKARKADIDQAGEGKINADEFKQRVAKHVG